MAEGVEGLQSPILKFMPDDVVMALISRVEANDEDILSLALIQRGSCQTRLALLSKVGTRFESQNI